jgi:hypothetical protein
MRLPDDRIVALLGARDGSVWIGTRNGLAQWKDGNLIVHARVGRFGALLEDREGTVWAGHTRALTELPPLCRRLGLTPSPFRLGAARGSQRRALDRRR